MAARQVALSSATTAAVLDRPHGEIVGRLDLEHNAEAVAAECLPSSLTGLDETQRDGVQLSDCRGPLLCPFVTLLVEYQRAALAR